jgi:acetylornithine deacetylase
MSSELERRALAAIDRDWMLALLAELIAVPSLDGEETPAQELVATRMSDVGLSVDRWEIDFEALRRHPSYSAEVERKHGLGVVGRVGAGAGPKLILNGHIDVVPVGEEANWTKPPFVATIENERVYGRGTADMKGGLAAAIAAARALRDAGVELAGSLLIESVVGEEDGGCGTLAAIERGYRADGAIILEPTSGVVAPAQAGALNFRVTIPGRAAHGCLRHEGVNPIEKLPPVYDALMALERRRNQNVADPLYAGYELPFAICVGTVRAGVWASTVAENLVLEGRYGIAPGERIDGARAELETAVREASARDGWLREHPPVVEWWGAQFAPGRTAVDHPIVTTLRQAVEETTGAPPPVRGMTYGADMRLLVNEASTPCVIYGPGDVRQAHRPDEYVPIADLLATARSLVLTTIRFCGAR